jgi:hypothetical protein
MADETYQERLQAEENVTSQRVDTAVRHALAAYSRRAIIGFVILAVGIGLAVKVESDHNADQREQIVNQGEQAQQSIVVSGDAIAVAGCNRDYDTIDTLRDELERSLVRIDLLEKEGTYTPRQAQVGRDATKDILKRYKLPDCRFADDVLTANPGKPTTVPEPRYPNDPQQQESERNEEPVTIVP